MQLNYLPHRVRKTEVAGEGVVEQMLADIRPDSQITQDFIDRNPVITNVQVVPDMSEHEVAPPTPLFSGSPTHIWPGRCRECKGGWG
jgi:hypothetical protein